MLCLPLLVNLLICYPDVMEHREFGWFPSCHIKSLWQRQEPNPDSQTFPLAFSGLGLSHTFLHHGTNAIRLPWCNTYLYLAGHFAFRKTWLRRGKRSLMSFFPPSQFIYFCTCSHRKSRGKKPHITTWKCLEMQRYTARAYHQVLLEHISLS